jgi:hypothetical protein
VKVKPDASGEARGGFATLDKIKNPKPPTVTAGRFPSPWPVEEQPATTLFLPMNTFKLHYFFVHMIPSIPLIVRNSLPRSLAEKSPARKSTRMLLNWKVGRRRPAIDANFACASSPLATRTPSDS